MGKVTVVGGKVGMEAPSTKILASDISVGSIVKLMENGSPVEYLVVNQGIPSGSSLYDSSCAGTWLLRKDVFGKSEWALGRHNYGNSSLHTYVTETFFPVFDTNTQSIIKQVKIPYRYSYDGSGIYTGSDGLPAKAFILSYHELNLDYNSAALTDGACLTYFADASTSADSKRIAYLNGVAANWWTRTSQYGNDGNSFFVTKAGYRSTANNTNTEPGVRPALVLPFNALFDSKTLILKGVA